jgi:hypothetical protein
MIDDDQNGLTDCADVQSCCADPYCVTDPNCGTMADCSEDPSTGTPACSDIMFCCLLSLGTCGTDCICALKGDLIPSCEPAEGSCADGKDNDGDNIIDCSDTDCVGMPDCVEICDDQIDNNHNGKLDCGDENCWADPICCQTEGADCSTGPDCCAGLECKSHWLIFYPATRWPVAHDP